MQTSTTIIRLNRLLLIALAVIPLLYVIPFYRHFHVYLTGTVINGIVKQQWHLVVISIAVFGLFLIPLTYRKRAKWIDYGLVGAFFVSLFIEMFGIPLTILFASKFLFVPGTTMPAHVVTFDFMGVSLGMDHAMTYGLVVMLAGMALIVAGWISLYTQVRQPGFAHKGLYRFSRHPQYLGFVLLVIGWFFGWPTILTVIFSPILVYKYIKAARSEEADMLGLYGDAYAVYMRETPFMV
jgi:protein-S-isoprenylcysteine O-methyltransferase Ste14